MTTYAIPLGDLVAGPDSFEFWKDDNTDVFQSPFDGSVQTMEYVGARWHCIIGWSIMANDADARIMAAFLASLRGQANRFTCWDISRPAPRGTFAGTPLVNGASQTGASLIIDGVTTGTTLLRGDLIGVNGELREIIADVTSVSGAMTLTLDEPLRNSPADNAPITYNQAAATFMLVSPSQPHRLVGPPLTTQLQQFEAIEVWAS